MDQQKKSDWGQVILSKRGHHQSSTDRKFMWCDVRRPTPDVSSQAWQHFMTFFSFEIMIGSIASRAAAVVVVVDRNIFIQYVLLLLLLDKRNISKFVILHAPFTIQWNDSNDTSININCLMRVFIRFKFVYIFPVEIGFDDEMVVAAVMLIANELKNVLDWIARPADNLSAKLK